MANTNNQTPAIFSLECPSEPVTKCSCGSHLCSAAIAKAPSNIPATAIAAGHGPGPYISAEISREGTISEKNDAASITPAANPNKVSLNCADGRLPINMGSAPTAVSAPVIALAKRAVSTNSMVCHPYLISSQRRDRLCGFLMHHNIRLLHGYAKLLDSHHTGRPLLAGCAPF